MNSFHLKFFIFMCLLYALNFISACIKHDLFSSMHSIKFKGENHLIMNQIFDACRTQKLRKAYHTVQGSSPYGNYG